MHKHAHTRTSGAHRAGVSLAVVAAIALIAALWGPLMADDHDEDEAMQLPAAVAAGVARAFPSAEIVGTSREEHIILVYEVELVQGDQEMVAEVFVNGEVMTVTRELDPDAAPAAVVQALEDAADEAEIEIIEAKESRATFTITAVGNPKTTYLTEFERDGEWVALELASDGDILTEEIEDDWDDEDDEDWDDEDEDEDDEDEDDEDWDDEDEDDEDWDDEDDDDDDWDDDDEDDYGDEDEDED